MSNYLCAILSRSDSVLEYVLRKLGRIFEIDQNFFNLIPIRPKESILDYQTIVNNQLEQLSLQPYNSLIIGVKFDRIDIMNHEIKQYTLPLHKYQKNIVILVTEFEQSEYQYEDLKIVQTMLQRFFPIKSLIILDVHSSKRNLSSYIQEMQQIEINMKDDDLPSDNNNFSQLLDQLFNVYFQQNNGFQNPNDQQNPNQFQNPKYFQKIVQWIKLKLLYLYNLIPWYLE